jgi:hypothetical protein
LVEATEHQERDRKPHGLFVWGAVGLALLATTLPARSDCVSPLVEGSGTTTVYPCPQGNAASRPAPVVVDPDRSTVVGRGSANIPWFEPKPTRTSDPITVPAATAPEKEAVPPAKPEMRLAVPEEPVASPAPKEEVVKIEPVPDVAAEEKEAEPKATEVKPRTKAAAAKPIKRKPKTKVVKATRSKAKVAKAKRSQPKVAQARRTKTKIPKPEPANDQTVKTEPAKSDDRIILMTKKDMGLGNRIKNWLRF